MKKKVLKGLLYIALGYLLLVSLHFIYQIVGGDSSGGDFLGRKYAGEMALMEMPLMAAPSAVRNYASVQFRAEESLAAVEQKYEKIAAVSATTEDYAADEQKARTAITSRNALIQEEAVNNDNGQNVLHLTIGVPPGEFEAMVADLKQIGTVRDFQITKTDKTNDFLQLKARRATLEKTRDSLIALKSQGGRIDELVNLEQEMLALEDKIQGLGVQLGQFDKVNEFCTVRFTLAEVQPESSRSPYFMYLINSLSWASTVYLAWLGIVCVGLVAVVLLLIIIEKSKIFRPEA